jgi:hypothetical protein
VICSIEAGTFSAISAAIHRQPRTCRDHGQLFCRGEITPELKKVNATAAATLSQFCVPRPGDIVACGTFGGTGWPTGCFLRSGHVVHIEIDGLGELSNAVVAYSAPALARQCVTPVAVG